MSKRRLTDQQQRRIHHKQQQTLSSNTEEVSSASIGLVVASYGTQADVEILDGNLPGSIIRCHVRATITSVVTGDIVRWSAGEPTGVIIAVEERRSTLLRPDKYHKLKPIAANIDQMIIVIAPEPQAFPNLIDRYLVAAHASFIEPILFLNKTDQIDHIEKFLEQLQLSQYTQLGYSFIHGAATKNQSLTTLRNKLIGKTSVFVGQSGVGKSSLINALLPESRIITGDLSEIGKGSHTTTTAKLFHLPESGSVIDSPGIREFGLWHLDLNKLMECFIEFRPHMGRCKFRDCSHQHEPNCAIAQAIANGDISIARFNSYQLIKSEMETYQADQY